MLARNLFLTLQKAVNSFIGRLTKHIFSSSISATNREKQSHPHMKPYVLTTNSLNELSNTNSNTVVQREAT